MRTPVEIIMEKHEISQQISALEEEIREKESELDRAKKSNLKLLTKNLGKSKRPASLRIQSQKLSSLESEINQLKAASPILRARQEQLGDELKVSKAAQQLEGYYKKAELFFEKIEKAMALLENMVERTEVLNELVAAIRNDNPLFKLSDIFGELETKAQFEKLKFPESEFGKFRFLGKIVPLEKRLTRLPDVVKDFSGFAFGLEYNGLKNLKIPEGNQDPAHKGRVYVGRDGPKTKIAAAGEPDIARNPGKYSEADVRKYGIEAANRR